MHAESPTAIGQFVHIHGVVEIFGVVGINRDDKFVAQIAALSDFFRRNDFGKFGGFSFDLFGELQRQPVFANDGENVHAGRVGFAEDFDDCAFGVDVSGSPFGELDDDFVTHLGVQRELGVDIVDETRIIHHDVVKKFCFLQRADDGVVSAFENADDAAGGFVGRFALPAAFALQADDDFIAVHGDTGVLFGDVHIAGGR